MIGWKARIGFAHPSAVVDTLPYEFYKLTRSNGVQLVTTILGVRHLTQEDLDGALGRLRAAINELVLGECNIVVIGGTPPMVLHGYQAYLNLFKELEQEFKVPVTSNQTAALAALKHIGAKKLAVANPFEDSMNVKVKAFLEDAGFEVGAIKGLGIRRTVEEANTPPTSAYRLGREVFKMAPDADAIYLSCARWPTVDIIQELEDDTGVPVIANTQAMIWHTFDRLKIREKITGYGKLLSEHML